MPSLNPEFALQAGTKLKHNNVEYKILKKISAGGTSYTYLAEMKYTSDPNRPTQQVVIKELFVEFCSREKNNSVSVPTGQGGNSIMQRWEIIRKICKTEARKLKNFNCPYIVRAITDFSLNGTHYTILEYVEGDTLASYLNKQGGKISESQTCEIFTQILTGVNYLHNKRTYHFDIKPDNILIEKQTGRAVLIDFGFSCVYDQSGKLDKDVYTSLSAIDWLKFKSPPWCPLELESNQFECKEIDFEVDKPQTIDLYSIAACMYRCIEGTDPPSAGMMNTRGVKLFKESIASNDKVKLVIVKAMNNIIAARIPDVKTFAAMLGIRLYEMDNRPPTDFDITIPTFVEIIVHKMPKWAYAAFVVGTISIALNIWQLNNAKPAVVGEEGKYTFVENMPDNNATYTGTVKNSKIKDGYGKYSLDKIKVWGGWHDGVLKDENIIMTIEDNYGTKLYIGSAYGRIDSLNGSGTTYSISNPQPLKLEEIYGN